ncbi:MAG: type III-A CRISPR-associated protein Cas10/Csm1, partial [candidate division WOR-3 bacterium]
MLSPDQITLILGALLHDIGKFYLGEPLCEEFKDVKLNGHGHAKWSASFVSNILKKNNQIFNDATSLIDMVLYHGQPGKKKDYQDQDRDENKILKAHLISIADKLSSKERRAEKEEEVEKETKEERAERSQIPLVSVFNEISLGLHIRKEEKKAYRLNPLAIKKEILFPVLNYPNEKLSSDAYENIRNKLDNEFVEIKYDDHISILHLLYKYIWASPSATPAAGIEPDISLFDHARTTAAIALCLFKNPKVCTNRYYETLYQALVKDFKIKIGEERGPLGETYQKLLREHLFILLAADMFGIQDFIYAPANIPGTSKRLRGRSFYLLMLSEIIARYIVYHPDINLSYLNILYCAGGNFQILLPNTEEISSKLEEICQEINNELFVRFKGKIGFTFAKEEISSFDFETWDEVLKRGGDKLNL